MISFSRADDSVFGRWWWSVDRVMLLAFLTMIAFGILMSMAATPMVANKIGIDRFYFLRRHLIYIVPSLAIIFIISTLDDSGIKKISVIIFFLSMMLTAATILYSPGIKGAKRWLSVFGFSIQPSEFTKPAMAIITAWLISKQNKFPNFKGKLIATVMVAMFVALLVLQPDIGMIVVTIAIWFCQLFLGGIPIIFVLIMVIGSACVMVLGYGMLPHVANRIDRFLNPDIGDHYQINRSLEAFSHGGLFGVGPGEGIIKKHLPDAHSDFVFAVLGEEFGFFVCIFVVLLIAFIVVYGMFKAIKENSLFSIIASVGLLSQFGLQSFINIASTLHILPTKGMTLPFISYGGSSMIALSISVGMILALARHKPISYEEH
ncbi:MAG: putative lipid II flippase FtsW [Holosporaceae bacterium]|jgi:cell division protein FtsW|nr:putative lipid II flippase FtsW [Holosporaceae bacterium]